MIALKKILVPHDFSDTSMAAVRYAEALADNFGAQIHLLHVSDRAKFEMATEFPLGLDGTLDDAVRERLLKILTPREQLAFKPVFEFRSGSPAAENREVREGERRRPDRHGDPRPRVCRPRGARQRRGKSRAHRAVPGYSR